MVTVKENCKLLKNLSNMEVDVYERKGECTQPSKQSLIDNSGCGMGFSQKLIMSGTKHDTVTVIVYDPKTEYTKPF